MRQTDLIIQRCILVLGIVLGSWALACSQGMEAEPNETCETAQDFGTVTFPFTVNGSLDPRAATPDDLLSVIPDVDAFRITGTPNLLIQIDIVGNFTPLVRLFDAACQEIPGGITSSDNGLQFTVPTDGVFVLSLEVNGCPCTDGGGAYELTLAPVDVAGAVTGRVVDAVTGEPLPSNLIPIPPALGSIIKVELLQCDEAGACDVAGNRAVNTNGEGQFTFGSAIPGGSLPAGTYRVRLTSTFFTSSLQLHRYQPMQTEPFTITAGTGHDLGDIPLPRLPIWFSDIQSCETIPDTGGICQYSATITNVVETRIEGAAWSIVRVAGVEDLFTLTPPSFQTGETGPDMPLPQTVGLDPDANQRLQFMSPVSDKGPDEIVITLEIFVGQNPLPSLDVVGRQMLLVIR